MRFDGNDPRLFQILTLATLLVYGKVALAFDVGLAQILLTLCTALATQLAATRLCGLPRFDPKSALISGLSLCLLLRTDVLAVAALAACLAIASKFSLRVRDKHVFNPTNFALVATILATGQAWISPAQWGYGPSFALFAVCAGMLVVRRAEASDVVVAFAVAWAALLVGRAMHLGDPLAIPLHQLAGGGLVIFTFFMISDPKTAPDSRAGRLLFAALVAAGAYVVQFRLFMPNGPIWALAATSPLVPLIDRLLPARRWQWPVPPVSPPRKELPMPAFSRLRLPSALVLALGLGVFAGPTARAFCGFYVARADTQLFNQASQVVLTRSGDRTVLTMVSDFKGEPTEFALVVPVPTFLEKEQIHVANKALVDHLDAYTAPRLVEYFDPDPCQRDDVLYESMPTARKAPAAAADAESTMKALGVTIEASYTVGEYDILILSAKESAGLVTWLEQNGYRLPPGAGPVVGSYLKQGMRFFVAKVNLKEQSRLGFATLRPLQIAFESPKFMLPIRLGTVNAEGPQELFVYTLSAKGRVETSNYRTVKLPSDVELPVYIKNGDDFARFYRDMFGQQVERERRQAVFLEYAWDMAWCDPCAADPLTRAELRELGVFWLDERAGFDAAFPAQDVFVTRLHLRYDREHFPEDLAFQETADRTNFQGRYVLRHPFTGGGSCGAAEAYRSTLPARFDREAQQLASLTGWPIEEIRRRMGRPGTPDPKPAAEPWWKRIWPG